jgi:hypothetical protein
MEEPIKPEDLEQQLAETREQKVRAIRQQNFELAARLREQETNLSEVLRTVGSSEPSESMSSTQSLLKIILKQIMGINERLLQIEHRLSRIEHHVDETS